MSSATAGNQWFEDFVAIKNDTLPKFSPINLDVYSVQVTYKGCKSFMSAPYIYTAGTNGIKNLGALRLKLSPNPARSIAKLEITGEKRLLTVTITNMAGKQVWQTANAINGVFDLPVTALAPGTYIVTVFDGNIGRSLKLVVAK
jgi:hypothetical protein